MEKLTVIVVEDEPKGMENLLLKLETYCANAVQVVASCASVDEAEQAILTHQPDLLLLDIQLGSYTAFDLLDRFSQLDFDIAFTTNYNTYASEAYGVDAIDYVLKPVDPRRLQAAVQKALARKQSARPVVGKLALPSSVGLVFVAIENIVYCEASGSNCKIFLKGEDARAPMLVSRTLKDMEKKLAPHGHFFKTHRSYLINLKEVVRYHRGEGGYVIMSNGGKADVSKTYKQGFLDIWGS